MRYNSLNAPKVETTSKSNKNTIFPKKVFMKWSLTQVFPAF